MPLAVEPEVLVGLEKLQSDILEAQKSVDYYAAEVARNEEALNRESLRLLDLHTKYNEALTRNGFDENDRLVFDHQRVEISTEAEIAAKALADLAAGVGQ